MHVLDDDWNIVGGCICEIPGTEERRVEVSLLEKAPATIHSDDGSWSAQGNGHVMLRSAATFARFLFYPGH